MVRAGQLTKRMTLQRLEEPADGFREPGTWVDVANLLVGLIPLSGRELFQAQQVQAQTTHRIPTHYRGDITSKMRLLMAKPGIDPIEPENDNHHRIFHIESVINVNEANRELELMVVEKVGSDG